MRIVLILHQFYPEFNGGTERVALSLARCAQRAGHFVSILASVIDPAAIGGRDSSIAAGGRDIVYQGVPVSLLPRRLLPDTADFDFAVDPDIADAVERWLHHQRFDLAHILHTMRMGSAALAVQRSGLPYLMTLTDFFPSCFRVTQIDLHGYVCPGPAGGERCGSRCLVAPWTRLGLQQRHRQAEALLAGAGARVCPSDFVANRYRETFKGLEFTVIPHGIDLLSLVASARPRTDREGTSGILRFGFIGTIAPHEGLDTLLRAFTHVKHAQLKLIVVGGFNCDQAYEREIRGLADDRVEFLGQLPSGEVYRVINSLDLLCLPSRWPETFSSVLHEAAAAGVPALVSDCGAPGEYVSRTGGGRALQVDDVDAWASALADLSQSPSILSRWRKKIPLPLRVEEEGFFYDSLYRKLSFYSDCVRDDHQFYCSWELPELRFPTGERWDEVCSYVYKAAIVTGTLTAGPIASDAFMEWIGSAASGDHLSRYLRGVLEMRPDVATAFDDGRDMSGLLEWLANHGPGELHTDVDLLARLGVLPKNERRCGINYVGYLSAHLGLGEAARSYIEAFVDRGIPIALTDVSDMTRSPTGDYPLITRLQSRSDFPHPITILHFNADTFDVVLSHLPARVHDTLKIGFWAWETLEFPEKWCDFFPALDEIWVPSEFVARAIRQKAPVPVFVLPHVVNCPQLEVPPGWLPEAIPEIEVGEFTFLFQFDIHSVPFRKNPQGAIAAFRRAFSPSEPVRLIVKTLNAKNAPPGMIDDLQRLAGDARITIWDASLDNLDRFRLMASVDAFVSLHRAEGFGLSLAEAMLMGKPVIATGWSGNVDFMDETNACLVPYRMIRLESAQGPYPEGTLWAEPDVDAAAGAMRRVFTDPGFAATIGENGKARISASLSPAAVADAAERRIRRLLDARRSRAAVMPGATVLSAVTGGNTRIPDLKTRLAWHASHPRGIPRALLRAAKVMKNGGIGELRTNLFPQSQQPSAR